jgi:hypothetical protein
MKRYAIFFPQFHQIKVNDYAWGYGFTDWALVAVANAFDYWPRRAPVAGFYDLAQPAAVEQQFHLAAQAGVEGFGIYHYWFEDGSELGAVERYLATAKLPDNFDYFYIWANESWSKRWAGKDTDILKVMPTAPSREQIGQHVAYLKPFMESPGYTRVAGRPLFVFYRPEFFRDAQTTIAQYRETFQNAGLNPLLGFCLKSRSDAGFASFFDFCYLFEPRLFFNFGGVRKFRFVHALYRNIMHAVPYAVAERWSARVGSLLNKVSQTHPFKKHLEYFLSDERNTLIRNLGCPVQNILSCGWNNAPRYRQHFTELQAPDTVQLETVVAAALHNPLCSNNIPLLCNAWNEWSEGAALEPCHYLGDRLLKAYMNGSIHKKDQAATDKTGTVS